MKHVITIRVKRGNKFAGKTVNALYLSNTLQTDTIDFRSSMIRITCERSKTVDAESILANSSNTIFRQILKALLFYGAVNKNLSFIHRLQIRKGAESTILKDIIYKPSDQPTSWNHVSFPHSFNKEQLAHQLFESESGDHLSNILSHWVVGICANNRHQKFESLWRAFEQLCDYHNRAKTNRKEFDNLREMRIFMDNNSRLFPCTSEFIELKDYTWLRRFQWRQFIYNNYPLTSTKRGIWENYRDNFVLNNNDSRIIRLLHETLVYREQKLSSLGYKAVIDAHIAQYTASPIDNHVQLAAFMCCKYAYFVRNRMFHGEIYEKNFRFYSTVMDDAQLDELNEILQVVTFEMIDNFVAL